MSFVIYPLICAAAAGIILVAARLLRLRYSLRSLAIFILFAGCCEAFYINWEPWKCERVLERRDSRPIVGVAFLADDKRVVTYACERNMALVWDSTTGEFLGELPLSRVCFVLFSRSGPEVTQIDNDTYVWDADTHTTMTELRGHKGQADSAALSPDRTRIMTTGSDPTVRIWDSQSGEELAVLRGHTYDVCAAAFSHDGSRIITGSEDGTARIWRRYRPEWWWGVFYMLEFWFSAIFAAALVWSLLADRRAFARMDCEAAKAKQNRSRPESPLSENT